MSEKAQLHLDGRVYELPIVTGGEGEKAVDISTLRDMTGYITLDDGYANTGSCSSAVTFIDGEKGILRYRGIPIEELAVKSTFVETAYLIIYGKLPTLAEQTRFSDLLTENENLHEAIKYHFEGFPPSAHPMAMLSAMINASSCFYPGLMRSPNLERFDVQAARLISQVRTIAAFSYRKSRGLPYIYPKPTFKYTANFLHMMFSDPYENYQLNPEVVKALDLIFLLHADHEQNCSTSTVRMVASSEANLFASAAAGVCALWGPLHGGANEEVLKMLDEIGSKNNVPAYIKGVKDGHGKLMGFGHRVYKNYDPRAKIIKWTAEQVFEVTGRNAKLDIALELERIALEDDYFVKRKLYPNVDFYSGIIYQAMGFKPEMFTVLFAIPRTVGWLAQWQEMLNDPEQKIARPRQVWTGHEVREFVPLIKRSAVTAAH
jgi:citrate synthase